MNACPVTTAAIDISAIDSTPLTRANRPITDVCEWRLTSTGMRNRVPKPSTMAEMSPPIGPERGDFDARSPEPFGVG